MTRADVYQRGSGGVWAEMLVALRAPPGGEQGRLQMLHQPGFSHTGAKSNSNISDHKVLLAPWLSFNEGLDCAQETFQEVTPLCLPVNGFWKLLLQPEVLGQGNKEQGGNGMFSLEVQKQHFEKVLENCLVKGAAFQDNGAPEFVLHSYSFDENMFSNMLRNSCLIWKKLRVPRAC